MVEDLREGLGLTAPAAKALLAWRDAGCPKELPDDVFGAMAAAIKLAAHARETGVLWGMGLEEMEDDGRNQVQ